jgi:chromosome partitioning protein
MKTVVISSRKGGVGKSAVAVLIAQFLSQCKKRVLAIDLDHQGHFGSRLIHWGHPLVTPFSSDALMSGDFRDYEPRRLTLVPGTDRLLEMSSSSSPNLSAQICFQSFLESMDELFDVCVIDTSGVPAVPLQSALGSADFVLCPVQLDDPAMGSIGPLFSDPQVGLRAVVRRNPKLCMLGLLPNMVEQTPFQRRNFARLIEQHSRLLIPCQAENSDYAYIPRRSAIERAQMSGGVIWNNHDTAARRAWREVESSLVRIAAMVTAEVRS